MKKSDQKSVSKLTDSRLVAIREAKKNLKKQLEGLIKEEEKVRQDLWHSNKDTHVITSADKVNSAMMEEIRLKKIEIANQQKKLENELSMLKDIKQQQDLASQSINLAKNSKQSINPELDKVEEILMEDEYARAPRRVIRRSPRVETVYEDDYYEPSVRRVEHIHKFDSNLDNDINSKLELIKDSIKNSQVQSTDRATTNNIKIEVITPGTNGNPTTQVVTSNPNVVSESIKSEPIVESSVEKKEDLKEESTQENTISDNTNQIPDEKIAEDLKNKTPIEVTKEEAEKAKISGFIYHIKVDKKKPNPKKYSEHAITDEELNLLENKTPITQFAKKEKRIRKAPLDRIISVSDSDVAKYNSLSVFPVGKVKSFHGRVFTFIGVLVLMFISLVLFALLTFSFTRGGLTEGDKVRVGALFFNFNQGSLTLRPFNITDYLNGTENIIAFAFIILAAVPWVMGLIVGIINWSTHGVNGKFKIYSFYIFAILSLCLLVMLAFNFLFFAGFWSIGNTAISSIGFNPMFYVGQANGVTKLMYNYNQVYLYAGVLGALGLVSIILWFVAINIKSL